MTPEEKGRQQIDAQLLASGWIVQDYRKIDFSAGRGIALREVPLKSGTCDYLLLVDRKSLGVVEAKKEGTLLSGVAEQSGHYGKNLPDFLAATVASSLPFLYESTGAEFEMATEAATAKPITPASLHEPNYNKPKASSSSADSIAGQADFELPAWGSSKVSSS